MDLNESKNAIVYEKVTDYALFNNRTIEEMVSDISVLKPDIIFRTFWQWNLIPNSCNDIPAEYKQDCIDTGWNYESLGISINNIKQELPDSIILGAVPSQIIRRQTAYNPRTNNMYTYPDTWNMALDPLKWGITTISKTDMQCTLAKSFGWFPSTQNCSSYDPSTVCCYYPDLTNILYQEILLSWIYTQIDMGIDGIWIDMFTQQAKMLYTYLKDINHSSIVETTAAMDYIINSIHNYGNLIGRTIYVGTWASIVGFNISSNIDFLTISPTSIDVSSMNYNNSEWTQKIDIIRSKYPTTPIICFIDWAMDISTPLGQFSQVLTIQQQKDFLTITKQFCEEKTIIPSYPVHGGWMGDNATKLSYGIRYEYDSKAPEFDTYNIIYSLINNVCSEPICNFILV